MYKIKLYWILIYNFFLFAITSFLLKIFPQKHFALRKWAGRKSIPTFISDIEIEGQIDNDTQLFLSNHQNMVDIPIIENILKEVDLSWVAKKELGDIFLFGNMLTKTGAILIQREDKKSLIELLKQSKNRLDEGKSLIIFPEGTRNKQPKKMLPFKAGAKMVAEKYGLKIQPIILLGLEEIITFEPLKINRGKLKVVFLKSRVAEKKTDWYKNIEKEMQEVIDNYYKGK